VVPEANHPKSAALNLRGANEVTSIGLVAAVLPTIQLDDDAGSRAREVSDVPTNRHLPAEPEAQFSMPKATP